ncbi:homeobox protein CDX-4 [Manacus vitellinus]|uniref:homeobox protein CDX-4 n=1 Tax=Manacus vitellinus TaxID=328815 RepID=UPI000846F040|nr:homeobox protein CDX-4 [Manacus vitellinus]XP_051647699.1 homeobox protein CDX-4-like [Manacus candei]
MYVSYLLEQESSMYPGSARCTGSTLPGQGFVSAPPYPEYMGYHPVPALDTHGQPPGPWGSHYGPQREDWNAYGPGPSGAGTAQLSASSPGPGSYSPAEYSSLQPGAGGAPPAEPGSAQHCSPSSHRHSSYEWMRKTVQATSTGKTRTREKYRVVYTDHQRLELEKEFHYNRYITIRRKSELAANLRLSERQVKIWFQNRRAKERKLMKKKMTHFEGSSLGSLQSDSGSVSPMPVPDPQTHSEMPSSLFPAPPPPPPLPMGGLQHPGGLQQVVASQ